MMHPKHLVYRENISVNRERRKLMKRALRCVTAEAAKGAPAKVIANETGIEVSEIYAYRSGLRTPGVGAWYALMQRRPDLKPHVDRITSGEATPEEIAKLIQFFQKSGGP